LEYFVVCPVDESTNLLDRIGGGGHISDRKVIIALNVCVECDRPLRAPKFVAFLRAHFLGDLWMVHALLKFIFILIVIYFLC